MVISLAWLYLCSLSEDCTDANHLNFTFDLISQIRFLPYFEIRKVMMKFTWCTVHPTETVKTEKQNQRTVPTDPVTFLSAQTITTINPAVLSLCFLLKYRLCVHKYTELNSPPASTHSAVVAPRYASGELEFMVHNFSEFCQRENFCF